MKAKVSKRRTLLKHQAHAIYNYARGRKHYALFMQMRLGKSLTAIRIVQELAKTEKIQYCLWLTKGSGLRDLMNELLLEGETRIRGFRHNKWGRKEAIDSTWINDGKRRWLVMTYDGPRLEPWITQLPWDVVVCDESTILGRTNKVSEYLRDNMKEVRHKFLLTGLPSPESVGMLFGQFQFLLGHFMGHRDWWSWRREFMYCHEYEGWILKPTSFARIKKWVHEMAFVLTRAQAGVGSKKFYKTIVVEMPPDIRKIYERVESEYTYEDKLGGVMETKYAITKQLWCQRLCGGYDPEGVEFLSAFKTNELLELLKGDLKGEKVVIYCRFRVEVQHLGELLIREGIPTLTYMGGETFESQSAKLDAFRSIPSILAFVAVDESVQMGMDLSVSDTEIYWSSSPKCEVRQQTEDRIISPVSTTPKLVIDLIVRDSVDEDIMELVRGKAFDAKYMMSKIEDRTRIRIAERRANG